MVVKKKSSKKVIRVVKKKGNGSKKTKMNEVDKVFKETVEYWEGLTNDVYFGVGEVVDSLKLVEKEYSGDCDSYELIQFIRVVKRSIEETQSKAEKLQDSISSVGIIKPIDELEGKVIGALRVLGKGKHLVNWPGYKAGVYESLVPLFKLAEEEGFSFPDWLRGYANLPKDE